MICNSIVFNRLASSSLCELSDLVGDRVPSPNKDQSLRNRTFNQWRTFWLFLAQVLSVTQTCREALRKAQAWACIEHRKIISSNTSAYCQARLRLTHAYLKKINKKVIESFDKDLKKNHLWLGRRVKVVDGSSVSMPDTEENQKLYPQPSGQKKGCGFPVMKIVALFSLHTGAWLNTGYASLKVHELMIWQKMLKQLDPGDVILADRAYCSFAGYYQLLKLNIDSVMRLHQRRSKGVKIIEKLGKNDWLVEWTKVKANPKWTTKKKWKKFPPSLLVRHVQINIAIAGYRTKKITVATTLIDNKKYPKHEIAELYRRRWLAELFLRDLKTSMHMDVLRCKSPQLIYKEMTIYMIAYNLIRALILEAALKKKIDPYRISFKGTISTIRQWTPLMASLKNEHEKKNVINNMIKILAMDIVPYRPNRLQPRAVKRRRNSYQLLTKPRNIFMEIPHREKYKKSLT